MAIFAHSVKGKPAWLDSTRDFCRGAGIIIMGWGPDLLTVEAKSPDRAREIADKLRPLGFHVVQNADDEYAGMLNLSQNPAAVQATIARHVSCFDISSRRWTEQIEPLIWAIGTLLLIPSIAADGGRNPAWLSQAIGLLCLAAFLWDGARIWGWRLEPAAHGLCIRRYFRWSTIPWDQIRGVETASAGRGTEVLVVNLVSRKSVRLGRFDVVYARNTRERLRLELAQHSPSQER
jgi:hypothetical protein